MAASPAGSPTLGPGQRAQGRALRAGNLISACLRHAHHRPCEWRTKCWEPQAQKLPVGSLSPQLGSVVHTVLSHRRDDRLVLRAKGGMYLPTMATYAESVCVYLPVSASPPLRAAQVMACAVFSGCLVGDYAPPCMCCSLTFPFNAFHYSAALIMFVG